MNETLSPVLKNHVKKFKPFYENGVLKPEHHHRLVGNADDYAEDAGIMPKDFYRKFS